MRDAYAPEASTKLLVSSTRRPPGHHAKSSRAEGISGLSIEHLKRLDELGIFDDRSRTRRAGGIRGGVLEEGPCTVSFLRVSLARSMYGILRSAPLSAFDASWAVSDVDMDSIVEIVSLPLGGDD